jgi:bifunctional DNA-binding transcriptional regulator/antitoxin component of YhaV-PrlF toxin-antitoxin module
MPSKYERKLGQACQAVINQKRRLTIPQAPLFASGLENGDRVRVRCVSHGRLVVERADLPDWDWPN